MKSANPPPPPPDIKRPALIDQEEKRDHQKNTGGTVTLRDIKRLRDDRPDVNEEHPKTDVQPPLRLLKPRRGKSKNSYAKTGFIYTYPGMDSMVWLRQHPKHFAFLLVVGLMVPWKEDRENYSRITPAIRNQLPGLKTRAKLRAVVGQLVKKGYLKAQDDGRDLLVSLTPKCPVSTGKEPVEDKYVPIERSDAQILSMMSEPNRFCLWYHVRARGCDWKGNTCRKRIGCDSVAGLSADQYRTALKKCKESGLFDSVEVVPGRGVDVVCSTIKCYTKEDFKAAREKKIIMYAGDSKLHPDDIIFDADLMQDADPDEKPGVNPGLKPSGNPDVVIKKASKKETAKKETLKKETPTPLTPQDAGGDGDFFKEENDQPGKHATTDLEAAEAALMDYTRSPEYISALQKLQDLQSTVDDRESRCEAFAAELNRLRTEQKEKADEYISQLQAQLDKSMELLSGTGENQDAQKLMDDIIASSEEIKKAEKAEIDDSPEILTAKETYQKAEADLSDAQDALTTAKTEPEYLRVLDTEQSLQHTVDREIIRSRTPEQAEESINQSSSVSVADLLTLVPCLWELNNIQLDGFEDPDELLKMIGSVYNYRLEKGSCAINWSTEQHYWKRAIDKFKGLELDFLECDHWAIYLYNIVTDHIDASRYAFDWRAFEMFYQTILKDVVVGKLEADSVSFDIDKVETAKKKSNDLYDYYKRQLPSTI